LPRRAPRIRLRSRKKDTRALPAATSSSKNAAGLANGLAETEITKARPATTAVTTIARSPGLTLAPMR